MDNIRSCIDCINGDESNRCIVVINDSCLGGMLIRLLVSNVFDHSS